VDKGTDLTPRVIRSKAQNYLLYEAGAYGNKLRTWARFQDIERSGYGEDVVTVGAAVSSSAWLGVFISAPAKSTPTRIELYPREFVFCPYRDLRVKGLRIIERRYCHVNPFRTDFVLDKQRRATTRGERA